MRPPMTPSTPIQIPPASHHSASGTHPFHPSDGVSPTVKLTVGNLRKLMSTETAAELADPTNMAEKAIITATLTTGTAGDERANSNTAAVASAAPDGGAATMPPAIVSTTEPDGVIHIRSIRPNRKGDGRRQPKQPPVPANPATVANSLGIPWSVAKTSLDSPKSKKWRLTLKGAMQAQGIADFRCRDLVEIEAGLGDRRYSLMGRASVNSMAYFQSQDLLEAGIGLNQVVSLVIVAIHRAAASPAANGGAQ